MPGPFYSYCEAIASNLNSSEAIDKPTTDEILFVP